MRILWSANAPWSHSGYGIQSKYLIPRFEKFGHKVGIFAWYGLQGGMLNLGDTPVYPQGHDQYGNDIVEAHATHFNADIVISLMDAWVLKDHGKKRMRWIPYMPVDHEPVPKAVLDAIRGAFRVVSYARFGERELNRAGVENTYIPHGVDTKIYAPQDQRIARDKFRFDEDEFVIGMVAANKGFPARKAFPENLTAVSLFKKQHPKVKVKVYLHTLENNAHGGVEFTPLLQALDFSVDEVVFCNQYRYVLGFPDEYMALAYNAMDVLLAASMSEGFGIPIIEAQACGTPVITTNFSSMPELTFGGYLAEYTQKFWTPLDSWIVTPSIESILAGLNWAYYHRRDSGLQKKARDGAMAFDWDTIVSDYWVPFLDGVAKQVASESLDDYIKRREAARQ